MDFAPFGALLSDLLLPIIALGIAATRLFGMMTIMPVFTRLGITGLIRGGVAVALAMPLVPILLPGILAGRETGTATVALLLIKEALLGVVIGVVVSSPFWAAEIAGELIDQQRQSESAIIPDPSQQSESGITATLLVLTMMTVFFAAGGMRLIMDGVIASYTVWPAMELLPHLSLQGGLRLLEFLDAAFKSGLLMASPIVIAMILAEISLALLSRIAPQLNVFDLALTVKGLVYAFGLPIYAGLLVGYFRGSLNSLFELGDTLLKIAF